MRNMVYFTPHRGIIQLKLVWAEMLGQDKIAVQICVAGGGELHLDCFAGLLLRVGDVFEDIGVSEELLSVGGHLDLL